MCFSLILISSFFCLAGRGGVIINTASLAAFVTVPMSPVYAATKAAVMHFCRSLAHLQATEGIRVNALCPAFTDTAMVSSVKDVISPLRMFIVPCHAIVTALRILLLGPAGLP